MAVLGVDWGERRIGLAVSDETGALAFPAGTIESRGRKRDLEAIRALAVERDVTEVVVGLPIHMNGSRGESAAAAERFAADLGAALGLPVETLDERWTTAEADRALSEGGPRSRKRRKQSIDSMAATILLRTYLEIRAGRANDDEADA